MKKIYRQIIEEYIFDTEKERNEFVKQKRDEGWKCTVHTKHRNQWFCRLIKNEIMNR